MVTAAGHVGLNHTTKIRMTVEATLALTFQILGSKISSQRFFRHGGSQ